MLYGKRSNGNSHGLVLTKPEVVNFMLDRVDYTPNKNLKDKIVIEPSAGDGAFLIAILERLLISSRKHGFDFQESIKNIIAFELDADLARILEARINEFLSHNGFSKSLHIVKNQDFLLSEDIKADFFIGNPPYVRHENIPSQQKEQYRKIFKTFNHRADLFIPFYEKCLLNLTADGVISFICSNRWLKSQYGKSLRELINVGFQLHEIIDLENASAFQEEVIAYPAITTIGKKATGSNNKYYSISRIEDLALLDKFVLPSRTLRVSTPNNWFQSDVVAKEYLRFFDRIENQGFKIGIGVATGADKVFIGRHFQGKIEEELLLPILVARDLKNDQFSWSGNFVLNPFDANGELIDLDKYPKAKSYFEEHKPLLTKRHVAKKKAKNWYRTIDKIRPQLTKTRKIILPDISGNSRLFIDDGQYYPHHNLYYIFGNNADSLKILAALLMSKLVRNQLMELGNRMNGGYPRWQSQNLKKLSIPIIDSIPEAERESLIRAYDKSDLNEINNVIDNLDFEDFEFSGGQLRLLEPESEYLTAKSQQVNNVAHQAQKRDFTKNIAQVTGNRKIDIFNSLFKGRTDVFAINWQKGNKGGYMPAYHYDPYRYRLHKLSGGTFSTYKDKTYLPLSNDQFQKHFAGEQLIGIYPLLEDNTSWFIAADFDKADWVNECRTFMGFCKENDLSAYLERSRSGNGGHVWIFFDQPYPALRSRKVLIALLQQSGVFSVFDKSSSFDRLFPNQDFHSGKGLGNLIALPLYKPATEKGNSCFVDERMEPYSDQWKFLSSIRRVSISHLDHLYDSLQPDTTSAPTNAASNKLHIELRNAVHLNRSGITRELINYLKEELNFANSEYFIKKKSGKNAWGTERYFRCIEETEYEVIVPRGFVGKLIRYCKKQSIDFEFEDIRKKHPRIPFNTNLTLRSHQKTAIESTSRKEFGVITAPPGSGKTVIGLKIIADKQQPALIVVHRKQLLDQWMKRIQAFLGIPKAEIGRIGQGKAKQGKTVTVAMIQSLAKYIARQESDAFVKSFGTVIVDECHHIPAETFRNTISKLSPYYQYGLTATPFRKGNDDRLIFSHLGEIIADIQPQEIEKYKRPRIVIRETALDIPFNPKTDQFETLSKVLIYDSARNKLILRDIAAELNKGTKAVIITERKEHIDTLYQLLKQSFEVLTLSGDDSANSRKTKFQLLHNGNYQALITTGQFFGEGTDLQNVSRLFLVYPFSFKGKLIQYIGRVQRSEITPVIYDYRDQKIEYLNRLFLKRNVHYRHFDRQATLFDDSEGNDFPLKDTLTIDKTIKVSIHQLDFRYGAIAFNHFVPEMNMELEYEIENNEARPEFDVLKPYFAKVFGSKNIEVELFAEFEQNVLVAQSASSIDLERINQEIIESVKFRFIDQSIFKKKPLVEADDNLLDLDKLQQVHGGRHLYDSEDQFLDELLKNGKVKHYRQLRYLASKHDGSTLKLRFVLNPFSFVFLLRGTQQFHVVMETLDTEEATYIWHTDLPINELKGRRQLLSEKLQIIEKDLTVIRNEGRQIFLKKNPENFSRLIHDYSEERKGFVIWKDQLEERLF